MRIWPPPRATLELPTKKNRLERIQELLDTCAYSLHDLSRVELDESELPRFNMPFELGLALGRSPESQWWVLEAEKYRLQKTLSDLNGWEVLVHENSPDGVLRELLGAFTSAHLAPTMSQMRQLYQNLINEVQQIKNNRGVKLIVQSPAAFKDLVVFARGLAEQSILTPTGELRIPARSQRVNRK